MHNLLTWEVNRGMSVVRCDVALALSLNDLQTENFEDCGKILVKAIHVNYISNLSLKLFLFAKIASLYRKRL